VMKILVIIIISILTLSCCSRGSRELPEKKVMAINGPTVYRFKNDVKMFIYKEEYNTDDVKILLNADSVKFGTIVNVTILSSAENPTLFVQAPHYDTVASHEHIFHYSWKPSKEGENEIVGLVDSGSKKYPFTYRVFVK
jgi:hypothetical protein